MFFILEFPKFWISEYVIRLQLFYTWSRSGRSLKENYKYKKIKLKLYVTPFDLLVHETKILPLEQMK